MKPYQLAWLNLVRRKTATAISVISITVAVVMAALIFRLFHLSNQRFYSISGGGTSVVGAKAGGLDILLGALNAEGSFPQFIPQALYETLNQESEVEFRDGSVTSTEGIRLIVPLLYATKYDDFKALATNEKFLERPFGDDSVVMEQGRWFEEPKEIVIGSDVARKKGLSLGEEIALKTGSPTGWSEATENFRIVGILRQGRKVWDRLVFHSIEDAQAMIEKYPQALGASIWGSKVLSYFWIFQNGESARSTTELINKRSIAQIISIYDEKQKLLQLTSTGQEMGLIILAFIVLLGGLSITAVMITRFEAMGLQIAVLRAIGYQQSAVTKWLFAEGLILAGVSIALGAVIEFLISPVVLTRFAGSLPAAEMSFQNFILPWPVWLAGLGATLLATLVPLVRIYRQDIHSSLKAV